MTYFLASILRIVSVDSDYDTYAAKVGICAFLELLVIAVFAVFAGLAESCNK